MKFTPFIIKSQEFNKAIRGFDKEEVKTFLEDLADEFEKLETGNKKYKEEAEKKDAKLSKYQNIEKDLQAALLTAQESTSKTVESTKRQANLMVKEAEVKAAQMINSAKNEAEEVKKNIIQLKEQKAILIAEIKAIVSSQEKIIALSKGEDIKSEKTENKENNKNTDIKVDDILEKLL